MASSPWSPDVWRWITTLLPTSRWQTDFPSLPICTPTNPHPPLTLYVSRKTSSGQDCHIIFSLAINLQLPISLWICSPFHLRSPDAPLGEDCVHHLFRSTVNGVLRYGPKTKHVRHAVKLASLPSTSSIEAANAAPRSGGFSDMFNLAFLTLVFLVCTYEAPGDIRSEYLGALKQTLIGTQAREASKSLMRVLGSNMEELWMRSVNLAITNRAVELLDSGKGPERLAQGPCPLFSYALSALGFWKVQLYCPVIAMDAEGDSRDTGADDRLLFSLRYQQLEGVVQLAYRVTRRENWFDVVVSVDNIRCDVVPLLPKSLMKERGLGPEEKHFPSRVSLQLTPTTQQHHVMSVSVSKSSDNPTREVGLERGMEGGFDPPNPYLSLRVSATETVTMSVRPWKFEQWVVGNTASLGWYLHDEVDGREVVATRPSKLQMLLQPRSLWFRDRYSSAHRPFTKQGGVIFAGDEYGESVCWKVGAAAAGRTVEWEITGWIWLTYWPNKHRRFYSETKRLEFRELVQVPIPK